MRIKWVCLTMLILFSVEFTYSQTDSISNVSDLVSQLHRKYSGAWYENLTFKQETFRFRDDSIINREIWDIAYSKPSQLNIRYKDFDSGRGWIIVNDSIYSFNHSKLIGSRFIRHEIMFLGMDMFALPSNIVLEKLKLLGIDLNRFEITFVNGKKVYQVGDGNKFCFWIFVDNLLIYGVRKVNEMNDIRETYFESYKNIYGKPVATELHYYLNRKLFQMERYFEIRLPTYLHPDIFNPGKFSDVRW